MNYLRCKCGKCKCWESGFPPQDCEGCKECGTTYAYTTTGHKPLIPHDWEPRYNERTGEQDRRMCRRCYKREKL